MKKIILLLFPLIMATKAFAVPVTYYDLDFEDGTLGGGVPFAGGAATNVAGSNLDNRALDFALGDQLLWAINAADSVYHYVAFDFYAEPGANLTHFLDVPSILRTDISVTGRHHVDLFYDYASQTVEAYLDGVLDNSLVTITAWPAVPSSSMIRIANQISSPGSSTGTFQIDNLLWQGDSVAFNVPEPSSFILLSSLGLIMLRISRNRK